MMIVRAGRHWVLVLFWLCAGFHGVADIAAAQQGVAAPPVPRQEANGGTPDGVKATAPPLPEANQGPAGVPDILLPLVSPRDRSVASPGLPPRNGRPTPGSPFDPGASGPGIGSASKDVFLGGALDTASGWPFVFLNHFKPRPERVEALWIVQTRDCPQEMGTDPWPNLVVLHFDEEGELVPRDPGELMAQAAAGRPIFIQVQGSLTTPDMALGGLMWSHAWLQYNRSLPPDAVVVAFDWPSQRVYQNDTRDINEKGRRACVAGYHLARFLQAFPPHSRVTLLGQSFGGRVVPAALHLLGGGCLNSQDHDTPVRLPAVRDDLHIRAIIVAAAFDHHWLDPGQRFERVLYACEALLNLYNHHDEALILYPLLKRSGHHRAAGRIGLKQGDFNRLGSLAARYEERDVEPELGAEHTLLDAVANRQISRWMAPYLWAQDPGALPPYAVEERPRGLPFGRLFPRQPTR